MRRRDRIASWSCCAALAVAALAVGGAPRWGALLASAAALACALPYLRSQRRLAMPPPLLVFLGGAAAFTALQLLPLPFLLVEALSPVRAETAAGNAALLGLQRPGWLALSMDPPATLVELAKLAGYLGFAYAAVRVAARSDGACRLLRAVAGVGALVGAIAAVHYLAGAERLFGIYQPERNVLGFLAPLLNPNHLAGLLVVATCAALGLAIATRDRERFLWLLVGAGTFSLCLLQRSRGGLAALVIGVGGTLALWLLSRRQARPARSSSWTQAVPGVVVAGCAIALIVAFTASGVAAELANTDGAELRGETAGKVAVWRSSASLLGAFPWTGVGRGAFEVSFARVHVPDGERVYSHVENEYLQAVVDWGWPAAALLLLAVVWFGVHASRRARRGPVEAAAAAALVALAVQNLADFSLELPGVALVAIALAAILGHVPLTRVSREAPIPATSQRAAALAAGGALVLVAIGPWARSARADRERVASTPADEVVGAARAAMARHPADFYAPAAAAQALLAAGDAEAVRFANRALSLHPRHSGLHRLVARLLIGAGHPGQACLEYRLAIRYAATPLPLVDEVLERYGDEAAARCVPARIERGGRLLEQVIDRIASQKRPRVARDVARAAVGEAPDDPALLRLLGRLEHALERSAEAEPLLRRAFEAEPHPDAALALSEVLLDTGRLDEAASLLTGSARRTADDRAKFRLLTRLADAYLASEQPAEAKATLANALQQVAHNQALRASLHGRLAQVERALGNEHRARWEEDRARSLRGP